MEVRLARTADKAALWTLWLFLFMLAFFAVPATLYEPLFFGQEAAFKMTTFTVFILPLVPAVLCMLLLVAAPIRKQPLGKIRIKWVLTALIVLLYGLFYGFISKYL